MDPKEYALAQLTEALQSINAGRDEERESESAAIKEALNSVAQMLAYEDRGWTPINTVGEEWQGLFLIDLKMWSLKIRESTIGAPWIKRGLSLRRSYIWSDGIKYAGVPTETRGAGPKVQAAIDDPYNQYSFFGKEARKRREGRLYHDGLVLYVMNEKTLKIDAVPLWQITGVLPDPEDTGQIWAYQRTWSTRQADGTGKLQIKWYFVDTFKEFRRSKVTFDGLKQDVDTGSLAFDMHANRPEGWLFGAPDALAAWIWANIARDLYMDGVKMSQARSTFAFKAVAATKAASDNMSSQLAQRNSPGSTFIAGVNDLVPMSQSGSGYDFSSVRDVIAVIASALEVSNIHLTSNPGDAGSSYGSAQSLDLPTRLAMQERRDAHAELDMRILHAMGAKTAVAYFKPFFDSADLYREMQTLQLQWGSGTLSPEEYKAKSEALWGNLLPDGVPDGVMIPNNENFADTLSNDANGSEGDANYKPAPASGAQKPAKQAASPTQGKSQKSGGTTSAARDTRTDKVTK